jgi:DNA invertase Pin-like site-specific DNA recombinase
MTKQPTIKAYSYLRFSTPEQMKGDSFRRQTSLALAYVKQHGLTLDEELTFHDLGVSAFRGSNAEAGRLADFREAVQAGRVQPGSYLLVESLDRISRMAPRKAIRVLEEIIDLGIVVVTLNDNRLYTPGVIDSDPMALIMAILTFTRANKESETKSRRIKQAWIGKREAVASGLKLTAMAPPWLKLNSDRKGFTVIEERAELVREIFRSFAAGAGLEGIAKDLNERGVPVFGRGKQWHRTYIAKLRNNPAVIGTLVPYQTSHATGKKVRLPQEPLVGYYPAVVDQELFDTVQAAASERAPKVPVKAVLRSILAGLTKCPSCGASMTRVSKGSGVKSGKPKLVCTKAKSGAGCQYRSVPLEDVERVVRGNIEPLLAMPPLVDESAEDQVQSARAALDVVEDELARTVRLAAEHPMRSVLERLEALEQDREELKGRISDLEESAIHTDYAAVSYRADNLRKLLKDSPTDTARINAGLRSLFDRVVVDYTTGLLRFVWKSGQESTLMFAWVEQ